MSDLPETCVVNGIKLAYRHTAGDAPCIVFVSGLGESGTVWDETIKGLPASQATFVYDRAGCGSSGPVDAASASGGGTGIGFAAAKTFAADGDQVVLLGRREQILAEAAAKIPGATYFSADLSNPDETRRAVDFICQQHGTVAVVIHSAGGNGVLEDKVEHADPLEAIAHDWTLNFRLNTLTSVLLTEALKEHLTDDGGRVLFISSISAYRGSGRVAYSAAKSALHPYMVQLAAELGPRRITVNAVAPGLIDDTPFFGEPLSEERLKLRAGETVTGRVGVPSDVAATLRWLASEDAGHVTAQMIQVNGGAQSSR